MLKRQLLGEFAARGALPVDELAAAWRATGPGGAIAPSGGRPDGPARAPSTRRPPRAPMRQPVDRIAWMLLLESAWWDTLGAGDHALLCALPGWHGELFRFLDRQAAELGAQPWAALRERLAGEPWAPSALALVDAEDPAIEPLADDLPRSLEQLRAAPERHDAMRVLGRI
jgi:DNA primase